MARADKLLTYFDKIIEALARKRPLELNAELTADLRKLLLTYESDLNEAYDAGYTNGYDAGYEAYWL